MRSSTKLQRPAGLRTFARWLVGALVLGGGAAAANGCGASIVVIECEDDLVLCDQQCVDTERSEEHCGGCNDFCEGECKGGFCQLEPLPCEGPDCDPEPDCDPGRTTCGGACIDELTDPLHCGGCGNVCTDLQRCTAGSCVEACECGRCDIIDLASQEDVTVTGSTLGGTDRYASTCTGAGAPDVAYRFVAPFAGRYAFDTFGSSFDTSLALLSSCTEVACNDDNEFGTQARAVVDLAAGQQIVAVVDGFGGNAGDYVLRVHIDDESCPGNLSSCDGVCVDLSSDPSNCGGCFIPCSFDEFCIDYQCQCQGAGCGCDFPLCGSCSFSNDLGTALPIHFAGSTDGLADEFQPECVGSTGPEALHTFRVPTTGTYTFDTLGSFYDTVLSVRDVLSCGELACNDDFINLDSQVELDLVAGQDVLVLVDGLGESGGYNLNVNLTAVPVCGVAIGSDVPIIIEGSTVGLMNTFESPCAPSEAGDQAFTFIAPVTRSYLFDTAGSNFDTVLTLIDGECTGKVLACVDDTEDGKSQARFNASLFEGQLVTIVVDGFGGNEGDYVLQIQ